MVLIHPDHLFDVVVLGDAARRSRRKECLKTSQASTGGGLCVGVGRPREFLRALKSATKVNSDLGFFKGHP